jgi:hypothetical protein
MTIRSETFTSFKSRYPRALNPLIDWDTEPISGAGSGGAPVRPGTSVTQPNAFTAALSRLGVTIEPLQPGFDAIIDFARFFDASLVLVSSDPFDNGTHVRILFGDIDLATPGEQRPVAVWLHTSGNAASIYATEDQGLETFLATVGASTAFGNDSILAIESPGGIRSIRIEGVPNLFRILRGLSFAGSSPAPSPIPTTGPVVTTNGQQFLLAGVLFPVFGANSWYIAAGPFQTVQISNEERQPDGPGTGLQSISFQRYAARVDNLIAKYRDLRLTVARIWAFNDGIWQRTPSFVAGADGTYDPAIDRRFDYAVKRFAEAGIRLILSLSNSHPDLGGNQAYVDWVRTFPGGDPTIGLDPDAFYQHALTRIAVKNHIRRQVTRVNEFRDVAPKDAPVFLAFEPQNEPRYLGRLRGTSDLTPINGFIQDTTAFIQMVDGGIADTTRHLIGIGSEGFMNDGSDLFPLDQGTFDGVDLVSQHAFANVDYITVHTFPNPNHNFGDGPGPGGDSIFWDGDRLPGEPQATTGSAGPFDPNALSALLRAATTVARALGKPLVIEEYGIQPFADPFGLTSNTRDDVYRRINDVIIDGLRQNGPVAGGLVWQLVHDDFPASSGDGFELKDILGSQRSTADVIRIAASLFSNNPPIANAGPDQSVNEGTTVTLNGTGSSDPDGDPFTLAWTQTAGPGVTLSDVRSATPTFVAPEVTADTRLTFQFVVNDGTVNSAPATVNVTVRNVNRPPSANAGSDQTVNARGTVTLDGRGSSDPDGDRLTFRWTQTAGPPVTLNAASGATPTFTAPDISMDTALTFQLIVNDGTTDSAPAQVTITGKALPSDGGQTPGGGGGCTINPGAGFDPVVMGITGLWLASLVWKRARRRPTGLDRSTPQPW